LRGRAFNTYNRLTTVFVDVILRMMYSKYRDIIVWPLCVFFVFQLAFSLNGVVLCIADNGLVGLETSFLTCCSGCEEASSVDEAADHHDDRGDCCQCVDVALDAHLWSRLIPNVNPTHVFMTSLSRAVNCDGGLVGEGNSSLHLAVAFRLGQDPPLVSIIAPVLLC
jgi:hypothetical protein